MRGRRLILAVAVLMAIATLAPAASAAPKEGPTNRGEVVHIHVEGIPIPCGLTLDVDGWFRDMGFKGDGNRNLFLTVFHIDSVYTNAEGDTWAFRDRGPDRAQRGLSPIGPMDPRS